MPPKTMASKSAAAAKSAAGPDSAAGADEFLNTPDIKPNRRGQSRASQQQLQQASANAIAALDPQLRSDQEVHGYDQTSHAVAQALAQAEQLIHPDLRGPVVPAASMMSMDAGPQVQAHQAQAQTPQRHAPQAAHPSPHSQSAATAGLVSGPSPVPAIVPPPLQAQGLGASVDENSSPDSRKPKRELSQTKRAAQNRAAQRAFRQRKDAAMKRLEQRVRDYEQMEVQFKIIQEDNFTLRDYIITIQNRLMEAGAEVPPLPSNINLHQPPQATAVAQDAPMTDAPMDGGGSQMDPVAQAVANLAHDHLVERQQNAQGLGQEDSYGQQSFEGQQSPEDVPEDYKMISDMETNAA